jgi:hypothetical protein
VRRADNFSVVPPIRYWEVHILRSKKNGTLNSLHNVPWMSRAAILFWPSVLAIGACPAPGCIASSVSLRFTRCARPSIPLRQTGPMMLDDMPSRGETIAEKVAEVRSQQRISSLRSIGIPAAVAAALGFLYFDEASQLIASNLDAQSIAIISKDDERGQYVQNFLVVIDLLFAILAGNAYQQLYKQQEAIFFALYREVTEAKSLLEQLTLVGQARPWYPEALLQMRKYITNDLRKLNMSPSKQLSARPADDPLEAIMYMCAWATILLCMLAARSVLMVAIARNALSGRR